MPTHDFSCASWSAQCYPRTHAASRLYTRPRCLHAARGSKQGSCTAFDRTVLTPCCRTHPAVGTLLGREESAGHGLSGVAFWHLIRLDTHTQSFLNQWGPGCDIQTRQRESVLFARDDNTTVPATAWIWGIQRAFLQGPACLGERVPPSRRSFLQQARRLSARQVLP